MPSLAKGQRTSREVFGATVDVAPDCGPGLIFFRVDQVFVSHTVTPPTTDKDTASFLSGDIENASNSPRSRSPSAGVQEADFSSQTLTDPCSDADIRKI